MPYRADKNDILCPRELAYALAHMPSRPDAGWINGLWAGLRAGCVLYAPVKFPHPPMENLHEPP